MPFIDLDTWPRRSHFEFFRSFEDPVFNVTAPLDVSAFWKTSRGRADVWFSIGCHYAALKAANEIPCFRYRLRGARVFEHEKIHGGTTVLLPDDTFSFCYFDFDDDFWTFQEGARAAIDHAKTHASEFDPKDDRDDLIHFTSLPWTSFSSIRHPRRSEPGTAVPKIAFGRCAAAGDRFLLPVAVDVHHGLVDGIDVSRFLEAMRENANSIL